MAESKENTFHNVSLPQTPAGSRWDVTVHDGVFQNVTESKLQDEDDGLSDAFNGHGGLLAPSLCHPHVHIDKAYLLSHPRYSHLRVEKGDFEEAMSLTGEAKSMFEHEDLLQRGQRLIDESVSVGVTHMRAFVEVDAGVMTKCLDAGIALKEKAANECRVQICAFAQLPLFSPSPGDEDGSIIRDLMRQAAGNGAIEAIGSTPYVESDVNAMKRNISWMIDLSMEFDLHLDFHLDYNLDPESEPLVWHVIDSLVYKSWKERTFEKTVVLGHCTRLTLFDSDEWERLAKSISEAELPLHFVGLPTSDMFMMRTGEQPEIRGTLDVPRLIEKHGIDACIGMNNIGNAFTPQGTCDPLGLACQGVGIYQAGTERDTEILYQCISTRAKAAIGFGRAKAADISLDIHEGDAADFVVFGNQEHTGPQDEWKIRKTVSEAVYLHDQGRGRRAFFGGKKNSPR